MSELKKCSGCKSTILIKFFGLNRKGEHYKTCDNCRNHAKILREQRKCVHGKRKERCKDCGGVSICEHNREKYTCKECQGNGICEHNRIKSQCKDCGGFSICEHNRVRYHCKECQGNGICEHNREKYNCKECQGNGICEHNKRRNYCKNCKGGSICEHNKRRNYCKNCKGGSICEHNRIRSSCKDCGGSEICEHNKRRRFCKDCDIISYLRSIQSRHIHYALKQNKNKSTIEYLGCDIQQFKEHLEAQFTDDITWDNYGTEWHIDHIVPIKYKENGQEPSLEEVFERLHFTNKQPMKASENMAKGNRYVGRYNSNIHL